MEAQLVAPDAIPVVRYPVLSTLTPEKPGPGMDLKVFLAKMAGTYARAANSVELMAYALKNPHLAHPYPLVAVEFKDGALSLIWCLSDFGHSLFVVTVTDDRPLILNQGWLKECRVLMVPR